MAYSGDRLLEFEKLNWNQLIAKFLGKKQIKILWEEFISHEFQNHMDNIPSIEDYSRFTK